MSHEGRWPSDSEDKLPAKIGECVWWLAVLADRMGLDFPIVSRSSWKTLNRL